MPKWFRHAPYIGHSRTHGRFSQPLYITLWFLIFGLKFVFEYYLVIQPLVGPTRLLWHWGDPQTPGGERTDLYCWGYNTEGGECSYYVDNVTDPRTGVFYAHGRGFGDAFPEWGLGEGHPKFASWAADWLRALRYVRSYYFRVTLLAARWSTPAILIFADSAIFYNFVAAIFSLLLATSRRVYHSTTWADTVVNLPQSIREFNRKVLAKRQVEPLAHGPEYYLKTGSQQFEPSLEACSTDWRAFGRAWNRIVVELRRNDHLSNAERDELLFETVASAEFEPSPRQRTFCSGAFVHTSTDRAWAPPPRDSCQPRGAGLVSV